MEREVKEVDLIDRTKDFAKRIINVCDHLPKSQSARLIGNQLFRSGTSVGANYRAACRGRSKAEFIAKLGIVLEEVDETQYWMDLLIETEVVRAELLQP
jgi:four helix bundle protein